jgi:hypothetical protein
MVTLPHLARRHSTNTLGIVSSASIVIVLTLVCCFYANAQAKPIVSVDLTTHGLPGDAFVRKSYKECPHRYFGYRSVEWLDELHLLVAFNTNPGCAMTGEPLDGSLRLVTFDSQGKMLRSTDVTYQAGDGGGLRLISHGGIWIGPERTIVVEVPSPQLKSLPDSRDKLLAFSDELVQIQEIDIDDHDRKGDGMHFEKVTQDRRRVIFWTSRDRETKGRECFSYSKFPIENPDACFPGDLDRLGPIRDADIVPNGYEFRSFAGASADDSRSSIFAVKAENAPCMLSGKLCPSIGRALVFDTNTRRILLNMEIPLDGRAALCPDGRSLAVLQQNKLEIFVVP